MLQHRRLRTAVTALSLSIGALGLSSASAHAYPSSIDNWAVANADGTWKQGTKYRYGTGWVRAFPMMDTGSSCAYLAGSWVGRNTISWSPKGQAIIWLGHEAR